MIALFQGFLELSFEETWRCHTCFAFVAHGTQKTERDTAQCGHSAVALCNIRRYHVNNKHSLRRMKRTRATKQNKQIGRWQIACASWSPMGEIRYNADFWLLHKLRCTPLIAELRMTECLFVRDTSNRRLLQRETSFIYSIPHHPNPPHPTPARESNVN